MTTPRIEEMVESLAVKIRNELLRFKESKQYTLNLADFLVPHLTKIHQAVIDEANKKMFDDIKADIASLEYDTDGDTFKKIVLSRLSSQTWFEALQDNK